MNANTQGAGDHRVTTDLEISLPRKAAAVIATRHGDVSVLGRDGDIDITSQHGDVSVSDINGKVNLNLDHSSARVSQIASDVTIEGRADDVSIEDIKGAVHLNGDFTESVKLAKIAKPVSFKSARTDMEFSRLDGDWIWTPATCKRTTSPDRCAWKPGPRIFACPASPGTFVSRIKMAPSKCT